MVSKSDIRLAITWPAEGGGSVWLIAGYWPPVNCQNVNTSADHRQHGIVTPELPVSSLRTPPPPTTFCLMVRTGDNLQLTLRRHVVTTAHVKPTPPTLTNQKQNTHHDPCLHFCITHKPHIYRRAFYTPLTFSTPVIEMFHSDSKYDRHLLFDSRVANCT
jgi:hypothetical protein